MAIPDAEHILHMMEEGSMPDHKASGHEVSDIQKDSAPQVPDAGDDGLDLDPPAKLQATCKLDSQGAKTKAYREKQRRAQLNNRFVLWDCRFTHADACQRTKLQQCHTRLNFELWGPCHHPRLAFN